MTRLIASPLQSPMTRMLDNPATGARADAAPDAVPTPCIAAVAVLCASQRRDNPIARLSRLVADLPLDERRTLAGGLLEEILPPLGPEPRCVFLAGATDVAAARSTTPSGLPMDVLHDRDQYRGTAGSLRDFAVGLDPASYILVVAGTEWTGFSLTGLAAAMLGLGADVVLPRLACRTPLAVWLVRAGVLEDVPPVGYSDFKEQALPRLASRRDVRVLTLPPSCRASDLVSVRTLPSYLRAVRLAHGAPAGGEAGEPWRSRFAVVEPGAEVEPGAILHDSVVLAGARVERGAVLARSVVDAGVVVRSGERVVDAVLCRDACGGRSR